MRIRKGDRGAEINITKAQKCSAFKEEGLCFQGHEQGNNIARIYKPVAVCKSLNGESILKEFNKGLSWDDDKSCGCHKLLLLYGATIWTYSCLEPTENMGVTKKVLVEE